MSRHDQLTLYVPPCSVRFFPEGEHCNDAVDGDLLIVKHSTIWADAISAGQHALALTHPEFAGYTWGDHSAIVRGHDADLRTMLSEMGPRGYERRALFDYQAHLYAVIHFECSAVQRVAAMRNDLACADVDYGWLEFAADILDGLIDAEFVGSWGDSIICSVHCTLVLMAMGLFPDVNPAKAIPANLALWTGAKH